MEVMVVRNTSDNYFKTKSITALIGEESDLHVLIEDTEIFNLKANLKVKRIIKNNSYYQDLNLNNDLIMKRIKDLSGTELKYITLIGAINSKPDVIILNYFEKGLATKHYNTLYNLIKNAIINDNISFLILSDDLKFINKLTKKVIIMKNKIIKYQGDVITAMKQNLIEEPEIIKFINLANEKGANLTPVLDYKELLKDIYRSLT